MDGDAEQMGLGLLRTQCAELDARSPYDVFSGSAF